MSKIDASEILKDGTTIEDDGSGNIRQVSGTDGGGDATIPVGGTDVTYDDTGNTHVQGATTQEAIDDIDSELITIKSDISGITPDTTRYIYFSGAGAWPSAVDPGTAPYTKVVNGSTYQTAFFADSIDSYVEWSAVLPPDYDGGAVSIKIYWSTDNAVINDHARFSVQAVSYSSEDSLTGVFGTALVIDAENKGADTLSVATPPSTMAIGGIPAANDFLHVRLGRLGTHVNDDLAGDAYVKLLRISYTRA